VTLGIVECRKSTFTRIADRFGWILYCDIHRIQPSSCSCSCSSCCCYQTHAADMLLSSQPENILCLTKTGNRIKIIDFGLARVHTPGVDTRVLFGTPEFMAPEVVQYEPIHFGTDMWSVGVICYVLYARAPALYCFRLCIIIIIIIPVIMFLVLSSWQSTASVNAVHFTNTDWTPDGRQSSNQAERLGLWVRRYMCYHPHPPSSFIIIITQPPKLMLVLPCHREWKAVSTYALQRCARLHIVVFR